MPTAEELLVAIRSEGVSETRQELDGVSQQMEETADQAGSSAEELEGFSNRFEGAITAAVSALAVGAAGLASQVPVLGELFSGVAAVVGAVAFQMDQVLRPVLSPLTKAFFGLSDAIFNLDGAAGDAVGIIGSIITAIVGIGGTIAAVAVQIFGFSTVWGAVSSAVGTAISAIVGFIGGIPLAIAAAIAAIVGFAVAYLTNWRGVRDKTNAIVGEIVQFVKAGFGRLTTWFSNTWAANLISDAVQWGKGVIDSLIEGIRNGVGRLSDFVSGIEIAPGLTLGDVSGSVNLGGGSTSSGGTSGDFIGGRGGNPMMVTLDGREIENNQGRYRKDALNRRG